MNSISHRRMKIQSEASECLYRRYVCVYVGFCLLIIDDKINGVCTHLICRKFEDLVNDFVLSLNVESLFLYLFVHVCTI